MPNSVWDGSERRKPTRDHDTLIEVVQILNNHVENFNAHILTDDSNFKDLKKAAHNVERVLWIGTGVLVTFNLLPLIVHLVELFKKAGGT